jgi:hypothetical protein
MNSPLPNFLRSLVLFGIFLAAPLHAEPPGVIIKTLPSTLFVGLTRELLPSEITAFRTSAIAQLDVVLATSALRRTGPLHFMGPLWQGADKPSVFTVAYPVSGEASVPAPFVLWVEPAQRAATLRCVGPLETLGSFWEQLSTWASARSLISDGRWREKLTHFTNDSAADNICELQLSLN